MSSVYGVKGHFDGLEAKNRKRDISLAQTKAVTEEKMREAIIKSNIDLTDHCVLDMIRWHTMLVLKISSTHYCRQNNTEKCTAGSNTLPDSCFHVFNVNTSVSISTQMFLTQILYSLTFVSQFPRQSSPVGYTWQISVLLLMHALTRICTCSPRIIRQLISSIGCEILGAPVRCFQFRVTTVWESLCDIRAWDRKRCREFARIKWTLAHEVVKKAGNATGNASVGV